MSGPSRADAIGGSDPNRLLDMVEALIGDLSDGRTALQAETDAAHRSPLDRLVADAGPFGKFFLDRDGAMPAGTSAFTLRSADAAIRVASRTGIVTEPVLAGNPLLAPPATTRPNEAAFATDYVAPVGVAAGIAPVVTDRLTGPDRALGIDARLSALMRDLAATLADVSDVGTPPVEETEQPPDATVAPPVRQRDERAGLAQRLSASGMVDLVAAGVASEPGDAPVGALLVYAGPDGLTGLELRTPRGFAGETIAETPLSARPGTNYRLSAIFVASTAQPAPAGGR